MNTPSRLARWFGTKTPDLPKPIAVGVVELPEPEQAPGIPLDVADIVKPPALAKPENTNPPTIEDARLEFVASEDLEERSRVLAEHNFFEKGKPYTQLDGAFMLDALKHIAKVYKEHQWSYFRRSHHEFESEGLRTTHPYSCIIMEWARLEKFAVWQEHAWALITKEPQYKQELMEVMSAHLGKAHAEQGSLLPWFESAEQLAENGYRFSMRALLEKLKSVSDKEATSSAPLLSRYPKLREQWLDPENDESALLWSSQALNNGTWLIRQNHPRIDAWALAERIQSMDTAAGAPMTATIAENTRYGALLKAWYGLELTVDEIIKHPLAHSLYVHKHAPMYLEEVKPLPLSWEVAMGLASTGKQFCEALVMTAKHDMTKTEPIVLELPELGATGI